jgi:hypothetical protein
MKGCGQMRVPPTADEQRANAIYQLGYLAGLFRELIGDIPALIAELPARDSFIDFAKLSNAEIISICRKLRFDYLERAEALEREALRRSGTAPARRMAMIPGLADEHVFRIDLTLNPHHKR